VEYPGAEQLGGHTVRRPPSVFVAEKNLVGCVLARTRISQKNGRVGASTHPTEAFPNNNSLPGKDDAMAEVEIGKITHYFSKIGVAAIEITDGVLNVGDTIHVKGHTSDFTQKIDSMQIDNQSVQQATVGQSVGFKVADHARTHDAVYKVLPE
jgi:hypothetical protein